MTNGSLEKLTFPATLFAAPALYRKDASDLARFRRYSSKEQIAGC